MVMAGIREIFTPEAEAEIRRAVDRAEEGTSGEIVPFVVDASDTYEGTLWKGATTGALLVSLVAAGAWILWQPWGAPIALWLVGPPLAGSALGYLLVGALPSLRRALIGKEVASRRVERRAAIAFLDEEVFRTRDRTGILLFLSLFERRVVVLGDEGINSKVGEEEWRSIVSRLVAGIRADRSVQALVSAIDECGELLQRRGVEIKPDDINELSDDLRSRER
jgi:putative membrane protein